MITAFFDGAYRSVTSQTAYLHDYGQTLRVLGIDLPAVVEAHFALEESGASVLRAGTCADGITLIPIPDSCLEDVGSFYCYIYDRTATSGKTVYKIKIPVLKRADMPTETTDPSEQDVAYFEQVLAQMEALAERAEAAAEGGAGGAQPYIVEFERRGQGDTATYTCKQTFTEITDAIATGKYVLAKEERYSAQEGGEPWSTNYLQLTGVGTSQLRFGGNDVIYMAGRDASTGDAWMLISPTYTLKSTGALSYTYETMSPATLAEFNSLADSVTGKADSFMVTITKIDGDNPSSPTADKTYEQIMDAVQAGAVIICTYTVQLVYGGEIEQEITQHLQFIRADEYNIHFGFNGWGQMMGDYWLTAHAIDISAYDDITVYDSGVEIATASDITTLTSRISRLEARVAALEGGN